VYNNAINDNLIALESYPFGKTISNKFSIASKAVSDKTILSANQIIELMNFDLSDDYKQVIEFSIDFWLLSFFCNGMNITDLLHLKYSDFYNPSTFEFTRRKTSAKVDKKITITLIKPALEILRIT
jgi:integrase/recombinase XerD